MTETEARELCINAHAGQFRRDGTPYHTHPIAVAEMMDTDEEKIVALLHDLIEDTHTTAAELTQLGYSYPIVKAVIRLTKESGQPYNAYLARIAIDKLATKVKIADMFHNISDSPTQRQKEKYYTGIRQLLRTL